MKKEWIFTLLLVSGLFLYTKIRVHKNPNQNFQTPEEMSVYTSPTGSPQGGAMAPSPTPEIQNAQTRPELRSLKNMSQIVSEFSSGKKSFNDLMTKLNTDNQQPYLSKDKNAFTGELTIVRTKNPYPSTRYFHAQYFSDENGEPQLQHMSFEFKPSPTAMRDAINTIHENFPGIGKPEIEKPDFVQWKLPNGYVLWAKKMSLEDLKDNPFNAYSPNDVGTIWVSMEADIHE